MLTVFMVFLLSTAGFAATVQPAHAAISDWQRGADTAPRGNTDFGSASFNQSLQNLKNTGANTVALVIPYYQSNTGSIDIQGGWNTPTDASLASAIDYAHSIGLSVTLKPHIDPYTGEWRAYINPSDRNGWFANYGNVLMHIAQIGQTHHAEMIVLGTELVSMSSSAINGDNTQQWFAIISKVRNVYSGKLTYEANSTNNNTNPFENEKITIGFWSALDYVGLSAYYNLNTSDNSVQSLETQWDYWNNNDLKQIAQQTGKTLLMLEVGYRSIDNAHTQPWNWQMGGAYNPTEQANDYEALMTYWNAYPYLAGVYWWNWDSNPNAGGSGDTGYTPQNKPAQQILTRFFSTTPSPGSGSTPAIMSTASANPANPSLGNLASINVLVTNTGGGLSGSIVDIEIYDQSNKQVFQKFFENQSLPTNSTNNYTAQWMAGPAVGTYRIAVGIFNANWSQNYSWNGNTGTVTVGASSNPPPTTPPPSSSQILDIWWPTNGATVSGVQPFKAMIENLDISQYQLFWQVGNGQLNQMTNSAEGYPHKEALVDLSGWKWESSHQYMITFVAKDNTGAVTTQKSIQITVNN